jgi:4-amino-4-deoxy-L-arabinose transferase-like glycosyltransferase
LAYLLLVAALVLTVGIGLRGPWPADEPQIALIAKDLVEGGNWFLPRAGGGLYPDKPPLFFGLVSTLYAVSGSVRISFLLPGVLAGLGALLLVTDLARRLWGARTGIWCGATLLALLQFPLQVKSGQIDSLLCFLTTLGLYGICRHLLLEPDWRWLAIGCFAAGFGVIFNAPGLLPLLVFVPYSFAVRFGCDLPRYFARDARWLLAAAAFFGALSLWLIPMLLATVGSTGPDALEYRDNGLFPWTTTIYSNAWGYLDGSWYLFSNAIPWLWLPASFLLPWLVPMWISDIKGREAAVLVLGGWLLLALLFSSIGISRHSVYALPVAPVFALIAGRHAEALLRRIGVQRILVAIPAVIAVLLTAAGTYALMNPAEIKPWLGGALVLIKTSAAIVVTGTVMFAVVVICRRRLVLTGYVTSMLAFWLGVSLLLIPALDGSATDASLMHRVSAEMRPGEELALAALPEDFPLQWNRPATYFGYRRDPADGVHDSAAWLARSADRRLLLPESLLAQCYDRRAAVNVGTANGRQWRLVSRDAVLAHYGMEVAEPQLVVHYPRAGFHQLVKTNGPAVAITHVPSQAAR